MSARTFGKVWHDVRGLRGWPADKLVLSKIADEANDDGLGAHPSVDRIAAQTEVPKRTVLRAIARLEAAGLVIVRRPERRGPGRYNLYGLPWAAPIEPLIHGNLDSYRYAALDLAEALNWPVPPLAWRAPYGTLADGHTDAAEGAGPVDPDPEVPPGRAGATVAPTAGAAMAPGTGAQRRALGAPEPARPGGTRPHLSDVDPPPRPGHDPPGFEPHDPLAARMMADASAADRGAGALDDLPLLDELPAHVDPFTDDDLDDLDGLEAIRAARDDLRRRHGRPPSPPPPAGDVDTGGYL